jgi:hypothetical protein
MWCACAQVVDWLIYGSGTNGPGHGSLMSGTGARCGPAATRKKPGLCRFYAERVAPLQCRTGGEPR